MYVLTELCNGGLTRCCGLNVVVQELDRQVPLIDEIDTKVSLRNAIFGSRMFCHRRKSLLLSLTPRFCPWCPVQVDKASADLKNTNKRLKEVVTQVCLEGVIEL